MPKEIRQPEQKLNSEPQPIDTTSCPNIGNTHVVCSQSHGTPQENDIWTHDMNKGVPQKNIQHFNTVKAYLDSMPKDENGNNVIDVKEFENLLNSFGGKAIESSNTAPP